MTRLRREHVWALVAGQATSLSLLAGCVWWVYRELAFVIGAGKITGSITWGNDINAALLERLVLFMCAVLLLHALLGLLGFWLARLTRAAFPRLRAERMWSLTVLWVGILFGLILAVNAGLYPASRFATDDPPWLLAGWHGVTPLALIAAGIGAVLLYLGVLALRHMSWPSGFWKRGATAVTVLAAAACLVSLLGGTHSRPVLHDPRPNIVILGLDSMRNDLSEAAAGERLTPHIEDFLARSIRFSDTVSPLARTYPAWVSILTGRHPVTTNARFNLMPRSLVHEGDTLAEVLDAAGYRSIFATDEVRFANFDRTYGFDQLITPPVGTSDFVVPTVGEIPIVNIVAGTRIGAWLFPNIHANRAAAVTYEPRDFVDRLDSELRLDGPSFLAIHMTLSHWPYSWAGRPRPTTPQAFRPAYRLALKEVDRQFADVLELLEDKGVLENAIVVVLSDHGEALGFRSDSIMRGSGTSNEIWDSLWGHGTSVLSPHQYHVLFALRAFGAARLPGTAGVREWPVSLEDVRPTLQHLATGNAPRDVDGLSLVPYIAGRASPSELDERVRFTETCFNTIKLMKGKITESGLVSDAGIYYEVVPATGWVQLKPQRLPEIMAKKQRAAISRDGFLARVPSWDDDSVSYVYLNRDSPSPRRLEGRPDPRNEPGASRLWQALETRFPGELDAVPAKR